MQLRLDKQWIKYIHKIEKANRNNDYDEVDKSNTKVISKEKNKELYDLIVYKLKNPPYSKSKKRNLVETFEIVSNAFENKDISTQCIIIEKIIKNISKSEKIDLSTLQGKANIGISLISTKISNCNEFKLITQSVTGLFESEKDLLRI